MVEAALGSSSPARAARRRAPRGPSRRATAVDHAGARRHPGPGERASPRRSGRCAATGDVDAAEALQAESRELGDTETGARRRARRGRRRAARLSCSASPTCRTPTRPTARAKTTTRSSPGRSVCSTTYPDHQRVPHWETATALGILDNERATKISGAMFTMQRGAGATLEPGAVPVRARPQCRRLRGDPPAVARQHRHADRHRPAPQVRRRRVLDRTRRPVVHPDRRGAAHLDLCRRDHSTTSNSRSG